MSDQQMRKELRLAPDPEVRQAPNPEMPWPKLEEEAVTGDAGRFVQTVEPHTEADQAAVLFTLLSAVGSAIARGAYMKVGADKHHAKLNTVVVGETSKARKGMSWGLVKMVMKSADGAWAEERVVNGLSSGEGLIQAVRDPVRGKDKNGEDVLIDAGVEDKRAFVLEQEFAGTLKVANREGNTLSPVIRQAWDDETLRILTQKHHDQGYHSKQKT